MRNPPSELSRRLASPTIGDIIAERLSRRNIIQGALASTALAGLGPLYACGTTPNVHSLGRLTFGFDEITRGIDDTHHVPPGYVADIVLRWGDPLFLDAQAFDPIAQSAAAQAHQFGYNNDYIGCVALNADSDGNQRALLCINHEFTSTQLMFPALGNDISGAMTAEYCAVEMAAQGATIVEIVQHEGVWSPVQASPRNRRITANTLIEITGPAAGHPRMQTFADPTGRNVLGTFSNCAGGMTPWNSFLSSEENFHNNFLGELPTGHRESESYVLYGLPGRRYVWGRFDKRFDMGAEPNEPNRFGWVVEIDPSDPCSVPKKRTALGRFKHEGAEHAIAPDGRVIIYMADDEAFQHVYKFVTAGRLNSNNMQANANLLDEGTLFGARFEADGTVNWLPLIHGTGPLTPANGFDSQADVLIEARRAGALLGATPMDRPEDIEPNLHTGRVYVMLTNNAARTAERVDAANPRADNKFGHIIEIVEPGGDYTAQQSRWEILIRCGDPAQPEFGAIWNPATSSNGWFGSPDNCAFDPSGRLWISTDGNQATGGNDGLWAVETDGPERGKGKAFFRAPIGAELCGPCFSGDGRTLFLAVQHPGEGTGASFETPTTRWPDFDLGMPPRPSILAIRRRDGGIIGS